jgi:hypothetical protein
MIDSQFAMYGIDGVSLPSPEPEPPTPPTPPAPEPGCNLLQRLLQALQGS